MSTVVVSDLHLGTHTGADVLRAGTPALDALVAALEGCERLVLLGDILELRAGPVRDALSASEPVMARIGAAMAGREIVIVPGNHDHALVTPFVENSQPFGVAEWIEPAAASALALALSDQLAEARVRVAYPGVWLREDVYATHGHYLDCHIRVPTAERLAIGAMARIGRGAVKHRMEPADYERLLAPIYAWIHAVAQTGQDRGALNGGISARAWRSLRGAGGTPNLRARALGAAFPVLIAGLNRAGLGPLDAELSGGALRRAGLRAMSEVVERLGINAEHVIFGHTHRTGPLNADVPGEWAVPGGARLHNCGSWVTDATFGSHAEPGSPYAPGAAVTLGDDGPPTIEWLMDPPRGDL